MSAGVNTSGPLLLGNLPTTTTVQVGVGGVLTVSNTSGSPSVSVSGPLTVGSITTSGALQVPNLSASAPGLIFSASDTTTGFNSSGAGSVSFYSGGTERLRMGATQIQPFVQVSAGTNPLTCGAATVGALSSTSVTVSGTVGCGAMTCGALSCTSLTSSGNITQPQYSLRVYRNVAQSAASATVTAISWDTVETTGSGAVNWTFSPPATVLTIPIAGTYEVTFQAGFALNATGYRDAWIEINPSGGIPGSGRRYAEISAVGFATGNWVQGSSFIYQFAANDTLVAAGFQTSGGALNLLGFQGGTGCAIQIVRLYP